MLDCPLGNVNEMFRLFDEFGIFEKVEEKVEPVTKISEEVEQ